MEIARNPQSFHHGEKSFLDEVEPTERAAIKALLDVSIPNNSVIDWQMPNNSVINWQLPEIPEVQPEERKLIEESSELEEDESVVLTEESCAAVGHTPAAPADLLSGIPLFDPNQSVTAGGVAAIDAKQGLAAS